MDNNLWVNSRVRIVKCDVRGMEDVIGKEGTVVERIVAHGKSRWTVLLDEPYYATKKLTMKPEELEVIG